MNHRAPPPASGHGVRSACDRCHAKKVRCVVQRHREACNRCLKHGCLCVFSTAGPSGRPMDRRRSNLVSTSTHPHLGRTGFHWNANTNDNVNTTVGDLESGRAYSQSARPPCRNQHVEPPSNYLPSSRSLPGDHLAAATTQQADVEPSDGTLQDFWTEDLFASVHPRTPGSDVDLAITDTHLWSLTGSNATEHTPWGLSLDTEVEANQPPPIAAQHTTHSLRILHDVQQKVHEEIHAAQSLQLRPQQRLNAFRLIDELHCCVNQCLESMSNYAPRPSSGDLSAAMLLTVALASAVELHERIASDAVTRRVGAAPSSLQVFAPGRPPTHPQEVTRQPEPSQSNDGNTSSSSSSTARASLWTRSTNLDLPVQVGDMMLNDHIATRVVAMILQHQISVSHELVTQLKQYLDQTGQEFSSDVVRVAELPTPEENQTMITSGLYEASSHSLLPSLLALVDHLQHKTSNLGDMAYKHDTFARPTPCRT